MRIGEIIFNPRHYVDPISSEFKGKYFLVLGVSDGADLIVRLLSSRDYGRRKDPPGAS